MKNVRCQHRNLFTGKRCGKIIKTGNGRKVHKTCPSCDLFVGPSHFATRTVRFRDHWICEWCVALWKAKERILGRYITWDEFKVRGVRAEYLYDEMLEVILKSRDNKN